MGTTVTGTFSVSQDSTETSLLNNGASITQEIVGSFDPNTKEVRTSSGTNNSAYIIGTDSSLTYTIQFQNTGTDTAFTVVVRDTLPLDLDTRTFQVGASSHPYTYSLTGNGILAFTFDNILLPDSNTNEALSHGLISFRIKPIEPAVPGTVITNVADIFFDFNAPVRTPAATVVVQTSTGIPAAQITDKLTLYPVPVKDQLTAILPEYFAAKRASVVGVDGRMMPMQVLRTQSDRITVPTQHLAPGAYVLTVWSSDGRRLAARFTTE